jgi:hypothetical protein
VKTVSDAFVELLLENWANVFSENYAMHKPGFTVKGAGCQTEADFFFQVYSKTAGHWHGHVRLIVDKNPRRMSSLDAVSYVAFLWRMRCGALTAEECGCISPENLTTALQ